MLKHFSCVHLFVTLWAVIHQAPLSMKFSRQEYWGGSPCPPPGDLPNPRIKPSSLTSPALAGGVFTTSTTWEALSGVSSVVQLCPTLCDPWTATCQPSLSITNSRSLLKLISIESVMPSNHLILCRPLLLPSVCPSIRVFSNESALCIRWPKYWSFSFIISPSNEYSQLTSFMIDRFDLLAVQGTVKCLLQHNS